MAEKLCFMTPTFAGDFERFVLLRESIMVFGGSQIRHYALVDTEDEAALKALDLPGVVPVTTASLLSPRAEALRVRYKHGGGRKWERMKRSLNKRFGWFEHARYYGWQIQQVLKLQAPTVLPEDVFVSFDSDIVVTAPIDTSQFARDESVVLYEHERKLEANKTPHKWLVTACRLLGVPVPDKTGDTVYDYVAQPFVFEKQRCAALQNWLNEKYQRPWHESLFALTLGAWSEFMIYGLFVRTYLGFDGIWLEVANANNVWIRTEAQRKNAKDIIGRVFDDPSKRYLVLQADHHERWPV